MSESTETLRSCDGESTIAHPPDEERRPFKWDEDKWDEEAERYSYLLRAAVHDSRTNGWQSDYPTMNFRQDPDFEKGVYDDIMQDSRLKEHTTNLALETMVERCNMLRDQGASDDDIVPDLLRLHSHVDLNTSGDGWLKLSLSEKQRADGDEEGTALKEGRYPDRGWERSIVIPPVRFTNSNVLSKFSRYEQEAVEGGRALDSITADPIVDLFTAPHCAKVRFRKANTQDHSYRNIAYGKLPSGLAEEEEGIVRAWESRSWDTISKDADTPLRDRVKSDLLTVLKSRTDAGLSGQGTLRGLGIETTFKEPTMGDGQVPGDWPKDTATFSYKSSDGFFYGMEEQRPGSFTLNDLGIDINDSKYNAQSIV